MIRWLGPRRPVSADSANRPPTVIRLRWGTIAPRPESQAALTASAVASPVVRFSPARILSSFARSATSADQTMPTTGMSARCSASASSAAAAVMRIAWAMPVPHSGLGPTDACRSSATVVGQRRRIQQLDGSAEVMLTSRKWTGWAVSAPRSAGGSASGASSGARPVPAPMPDRRSLITSAVGRSTVYSASRNAGITFSTSE
jgi:hypothetical protein